MPQVATRLKHVRAVGGLYRREQAERIEVHAHQQHRDKHRRAREQQQRLDDLHPRRGEHAAEDHVDHHADAGKHDSSFVRDAQHEFHQHPRPGHLRHEVGEVDDHGADHRREPRLRRPHPIGDHVAQSESASVAHRLGHHHQDDQKTRQCCNRVERPVHAVQRDQAREAEECGRAHPVAGEGKAVLARREVAARRVKVARRARAPRGPPGDEQRQRQNDGEDDECQCLHRVLPAPSERVTASACVSKSRFAVNT